AASVCGTYLSSLFLAAAFFVVFLAAAFLVVLLPVDLLAVDFFVCFFAVDFWAVDLLVVFFVDVLLAPLFGLSSFLPSSSFLDSSAFSDSYSVPKNCFGSISLPSESFTELLAMLIARALPRRTSANRLPIWPACCSCMTNWFGSMPYWAAVKPM